MPAAETKQNMQEMKMAFATPVERQKIPVVDATKMTEMDKQLPVADEVAPYAHCEPSHAPQIPPLPSDQGKTTNEASTQETKRPDKP